MQSETAAVCSVDLSGWLDVSSSMPANPQVQDQKIAPSQNIVLIQTNLFSH